METLVWVSVGAFLSVCAWILLVEHRNDLTRTLGFYDKSQHRTIGNRQANRLAVLSPYLYVDRSTAVVVQKEGLLQKTITFRGPDLDSASDLQAERLSAAVNKVLMRKGTGWAFHFEAQRFQVRDYEVSDFPSRAQKIIEQERHDTFTQEMTYFDSSYYLTITFAPPKDRAKKILSFFSSEADGLVAEREIEGFAQEVADLQGELSKSIAVEALSANETVSYLHTAFSWNWFQMSIPNALCFLDSVLFDQDIHVSGDIIAVGNYLTKVVTIQGFPSGSYPGILDKLNRLGFGYRWVTRWIPYDYEDAIAELTKYQATFFGDRQSFKDSVKDTPEPKMINAAADSKMGQSMRAIEALAEGRTAYGKFNVTIQVYQEVINGEIKEARAALNKTVSALITTINAATHNAKVEEINALEAWKGMFPGNVYANIRRYLHGSERTTDVLPISAVWRGRLVNQYMGDNYGNYTPFITCGTERTTPFYLNMDQGDVRHATVTGPTGMGKTTLLNTLGLSFGKYVHKGRGNWSRTYAFDLDRSMRQIAMAIGATRYEPGVPNSATGLALQPLRHLETEQDIAWATDFIMSLVKLQGTEISPKMRREINGALKDMSEFPVSQRTMTTFLQTVQHEEGGEFVLQTALRPYVLGGEYGQIFDADDFSLKDNFYTVIEMRPLLNLGLKAAGPALAFIFREIEMTFDDTPTQIIFDEAWKFFEFEMIVGWIMSLFNTGRKNKIGIILCTQSLGAILKSPVSDSVLLNSPTKIFLPHEEAMSNQEIYEKFNLRQEEILVIAEAVPKREYVYKSPEGFRKFQLCLGPKALKLMTGCPHDVLDTLEGREPDEIVDFLLRYQA